MRFTNSYNRIKSHAIFCKFDNEHFRCHETVMIKLSQSGTQSVLWECSGRLGQLSRRLHGDFSVLSGD